MNIVIIERNEKELIKQEEQKKQIKIYCAAVEAKETLNQIIEMTKRGGNYEKNKVNDILDTLWTNLENMQYYNNI